MRNFADRHRLQHCHRLKHAVTIFVMTKKECNHHPRNDKKKCNHQVKQAGRSLASDTGSYDTFALEIPTCPRRPTIHSISHLPRFSSCSP
ncbi:hypothetical protein HYQ46_004730 [Verticillium longisporum]|nr:hypothetical protein HYQ46_004730 [Verticillium longisporum]